MNYIVIYSTVI